MDELTAKNNYTTLHNELTEFRTIHIENHTEEKKNYRDLLNLAKVIQKKVSDTIDLLLEDRESLTNELNAIFSSLKQAQDQEWETRRVSSEGTKKKMMEEIRELGAEYERLCNEPNDEARKNLNKCENDLRKFKDRFREGAMLKEDHDEVWYLYQETWETVNQRKRIESYSNREKFMKDAEAIRETLRTRGAGAARNQLREVQKSRNGFFFLHDDFKKLQTFFDEIYSEINSKSSFQGDFLKMLETRITNGKEFLIRAKSRAEKINSNIKKNEERMKEAPSEEFRQKLEHWVNEDSSEYDKLTKRIAKVEKEVSVSEEKLKRKRDNIAAGGSSQPTEEELKQFSEENDTHKE